MRSAAHLHSRDRQHAQSAETRAAILAAAELAFAKSGLAGARIDRIAAEAGVNKALLYYYFKSKEALYEAVVEHHFAEFSRRALELLAASGPAPEILLRYVNLHFDFISAKRRCAPLFQQMMLAGGKPLERLFRKHIIPRGKALNTLLVRGMREGDFRRTDPFHTGLSITALIVFYFSAARGLQLLGNFDPYSDANLKRRKQEIVDFIRHGLFVNRHSPAT
jgi:TetR/AcrR family transcriptional regulator